MDTRILYQLCIVLITHLDNASAFATLLIYGRLSYAVENHDFILSCESSEEAAAIVWTRDGADISAAYVESNVCKSADTGTGLLSNYRYNCTDNKTFHLIIPGDRILQEDGSKWQCKEAGGGVSSNVYILTVTKESESDSKNVLGLVIGSGFGCIAVIFLVVISVIFIIQGMKKPSKATYGKRNNSDTNQHIDGRLQTSIDQRANDKIHFEDVYENAGADIESDHREYNLGASHDTTINSVIESEEAAWTLTGSSEFAVAGESFTLTCNPQDSKAVAVKWKRLDIDTTDTGTSRATIEATGCKSGSGSDTQ